MNVPKDSETVIAAAVNDDIGLKRLPNLTEELQLKLEKAV
jgi:hypothetical protein